MVNKRFRPDIRAKRNSFWDTEQWNIIILGAPPPPYHERVKSGFYAYMEICLIVIFSEGERGYYPLRSRLRGG